MTTELETRECSWGERALVIGGLRSGIRLDGRGPLDYRDVCVETGVIRNAYGSSRVSIGATELLASVKADVRRCDPTHSNHGSVVFSVRFSPVAGRRFVGSSGEALCEETASVLTQAYGSPGTLDFGKLCAREKTYYWVLRVDLVILAYGGNLLDTAGFAVKSALFDTSLPQLDVELESDGNAVVHVDSDPRRSDRLDITNAPLVLTFLCAGDQLVLDPTVEEEDCASAKIVVAVCESGITFLSKLGDACVFQSTLEAVAEKAEKLAEEYDVIFMDVLRKVDSTGTLAKLSKP